MIYKISPILCAAFFVCMTGISYGKTFKLDVPAGKTTGLYYLWAYNRTTCYGAQYPKVRLKQPDHGKLTHRKERVRIPKGKPCAGKMAFRTVVFYTPDRGFRGKDIVSFGFSYPRYDGEMNRQRVNFRGVLTVK